MFGQTSFWMEVIYLQNLLIEYLKKHNFWKIPDKNSIFADLKFIMQLSRWHLFADVKRYELERLHFLKPCVLMCIFKDSFHSCLFLLNNIRDTEKCCISCIAMLILLSFCKMKVRGFNVSIRNFEIDKHKNHF